MIDGARRCSPHPSSSMPNQRNPCIPRPQRRGAPHGEWKLEAAGWFRTWPHAGSPWSDTRWSNNQTSLYMPIFLALRPHCQMLPRRLLNILPNVSKQNNRSVPVHRENGLYNCRLYFAHETPVLNPIRYLVSSSFMIALPAFARTSYRNRGPHTFSDIICGWVDLK